MVISNMLLRGHYLWHLWIILSIVLSFRLKLLRRVAGEKGRRKREGRRRHAAVNHVVIIPLSFWTMTSSIAIYFMSLPSLPTHLSNLVLGERKS